MRDAWLLGIRFALDLRLTQNASWLSDVYLFLYLFSYLFLYLSPLYVSVERSRTVAVVKLKGSQKQDAYVNVTYKFSKRRETHFSRHF